MLYVITGSNGGGKSLRAVWLMEKLAREGVNVYAWNFNGLAIPGVVVHQNVDPVNWRDLPPNSALFVDEAQEVWRARRGNKEEPPELRDMETHRKAGIDIYLVTPSPSFLDNHVKPLVNKHWHCIAYTDHSSRVFEFSECQDNPQGMAKRAHAKFEVWEHPRKCYEWYKSAEAHLKKPRPPWQHYWPRIAKVGVVLIALGICWLIWGPKDSSKAGKAGLIYGLAASAQVQAESQSMEAFLAQFKPRVAEMPWSAPAYDGQGVAAEPRVFCMSSEHRCRCVTEQNTVYVMPHDRCLRMARWGEPYNPRRSPMDVAPASAPMPAPEPVQGAGRGGVASGDPASVGSPGMGLVQGR